MSNWIPAVDAATTPGTTIPGYTTSPAVEFKGTSGSPLPTTLDGVTLVMGATTGSRILVKDQPTASENGVYQWTSGSTGATAVWTQTSDYTVGTDNQVLVRVKGNNSGTVNPFTEWALSTASSSSPYWARQILRANVKDFGAKSDGSTDDSSAIATAIAAVTTAGGAVVFPPAAASGGYVVGSAAVVTTPVNVQLTFEEAAMIAPSGQTVALNGRVSAHPTQQIIGGTGSVGAMNQTSGSGPLITVAGVYNAYPLFAVKIITGGALSSGNVQFQYSLTGASGSYSSTVTIPASTSAWSYAVPNTGVTITFPTGTYSTSSLAHYAWTSGDTTPNTTGLSTLTAALTTAGTGPYGNLQIVVSITTTGTWGSTPYLQFSYSVNGVTIATGVTQSSRYFAIPGTGGVWMSS